MSICKVAIVGAGSMAREHIKAFSAMPSVEIAGVFSRTMAKARQVAADFEIPRVLSSIDELYSETNADLVVIAVSELSAREVAEEAFRYPWLCMIEKPAGYDYEDAVKMRDAADGQGVRAYVALNRRHYSSTRTVTADLEQIEGQRLVHLYDQEDPTEALAAGWPERVVRNWMYANSVHVVDYLRLFCRGDVVTVQPIMRWDPSDPRFVVTEVRFSSGDVAIYEAVWNGPGPWAVTVSTQVKRWEMRPLERASFQVYGSRKSEILPMHPWDAEFKPGLRLQAQEAVNAACGLRHSLPTLADGLETMHLIKRIYEI